MNAQMNHYYSQNPHSSGSTENLMPFDIEFLFLITAFFTVNSSNLPFFGQNRGARWKRLLCFACLPEVYCCSSKKCQDQHRSLLL